MSVGMSGTLPTTKSFASPTLSNNGNKMNLEAMAANRIETKLALACLEFLLQYADRLITVKTLRETSLIIDCIEIVVAKLFLH